MDKSPAGRDIEYVKGTPETISARGAAIGTLGEQMIDSAIVLERIATRATDQQGEAVDKLIETIGDAYKQLKEAGELYKPIGPVLVTYGDKLAELKPKIDTRVDTCDELWASYQGLPGKVDPRGAGGLFQPDEGSPEADAQAEEDAAKKVAFEAWEGEAEDFDADYNTWEQAFDDAVSGITDEMSGKIADGWTQWLAAIKNVLSWAGFVLGIAAIIIGGPIIGALAAIVAGLTLIIVVIQFARGEATWVDLTLAIIDVIPIGKIGGILAEGGTWATKGGKFGSEFVSQFTNVTNRTGLDDLAGLIKNPSSFGGVSGGLSGVMTRLFTGKEPKFFEDLGGAGGWQLFAGVVEMQRGLVGAIFKVDGMFAKVLPDYDGMKKEVGKVDVGDTYLPVLDVIW
ncbi:hypothetical protein ACTU6U_07975 [Microbacterium sp. A196]|uniref:hypothetical protein n=1 Tax=unclassified Microbacterium TaxID=2609290 RepID=UPI003FD0EDCA